MQQRYILSFLLAAGVSSAAAGAFSASKGILQPSRAAEAPAAAAPTGPTLKGCSITFTLDNYDYADLPKEVCDNDTVTETSKLKNVSKIAAQSVVSQNKSSENQTQSGSSMIGDVISSVGDLLNGAGEAVMGGVEGMMNSSGPSMLALHAALPKLASAPAPGPAPGPAGPPLIVCDTVGTMLRRTIEKSVRYVLKHPPAPGPAPAPAPSTVTLLRGAASRDSLPEIEIPAALSPASPEVDVFMRFRPGKEKKDADGKVVGRSVIVDMTLTGKPNNSINDIEEMKPHLVMTAAAASGTLSAVLGDALYETTGVRPLITPFQIEEKDIQQWSVEKCQKHFSRIVKRFSVAYTRGQVPLGLYNECTNFMTRLTFSDDLIIDDLDKHACRQATKEFAKRWKYGTRGKDEISAEGEFDGFCEKACEFKYGGAHPTCHVTEGQGLADNP